MAWSLGDIVIVWGIAYKMAAPELWPNSYANELADNGWRSFLWAARQNRLDYRQFYATRPEDDVMADLQRLFRGQPDQRNASAGAQRHLPAGQAAERRHRHDGKHVGGVHGKLRIRKA